MSDLGGNPFAQLFPSLERAQQYSARIIDTGVNNIQNEAPTDIQDTPPNKSTDAAQLSDEHVVEQIQNVNAAIQRIFLFTLNKYSVLGTRDSDGLVFLSQLAETIGTHNQSWLDVSTLEQALFERLMLESPEEQVVRDESVKGPVPEYVKENRLVYYLYSCYTRSCTEKERKPNNEELNKSIDNMQGVIVQNLVTAFREPELYFNQNIQEQLEELILNKYQPEECLMQLVNKFASRMKEEEGNHSKLKSIVEPMLVKISTRIKETSLIVFSQETVTPLIYFLKNAELARIFIEHSTPVQTNHLFGTGLNLGAKVNGKSYEATLLGSILCKSSIPTTDAGPWDFFLEPSRSPGSVHSRTEAQIWSGLESVHSALHSIFNSLLRVNEEVKHLTLDWIAKCLAANTDRGKIWTSQMGPLMSTTLASDGFMLNLGSVLLRFCTPFTEDKNRMERINPRYCSTPSSELLPVHLASIQQETCLITLQEGTEKPKSDNPFNFPTEIFFLAHRALDLGFRTVQEKFSKLNQELSRLEGAFQDAQASGGGPAATDIQKRMEESMTKFLSLKAALLEPATLEKQTSLIASTCAWLVKLATGSSTPTGIEELTTVPQLLSCVPEFLIVNTCEHILLIRRFNPGLFEQHGHRLPDIFQMILVLMGKPIWLKNPHLRARLAESLECLLPYHEHQGQPNILGNYQRQALFQDHPMRLNLVTAILHVFVSIEETGQSVEFEQKFSYRRPMYDVIKYIWTLDEFKAKFSSVAAEAETNIESENPPIFLRFINLLINDAIFLLDEGLNYMRSLQEQEQARPGWASLSAQERMDNERQYAHSGQLAKYHNLMGSETIAVLELMTSGIKSVITHPSMTDRLAAMLNYFLKTLTGPDRKSFKVSNLLKYEFKPGDVVARICQIYINLGDSERFLISVSADGRSYCPELFTWTQDVLIKISKAYLITGITEIAEKVAKLSTKKAAEEELLADAPDEFLCPIMSILMTEPVILPSSKQIVDRSTISRHLLSDQSDPFNRNPLTMDQVKSAEELRAKIHAWIEEKKSGKTD